ncbi:MAG: hypothetical protein LWX83_00590 [Anaerolineae bacterium]|nr:hypothetical protein [Anaerolineae bacterium]
MKKTLLGLMTLFSILTLAAVPLRRADDGLSVSPASADKADLPNSVVTYDLSLTNNTGVDQVVAVAVNAGSRAWNAWASSGSLSVASGQSANVTVSVAIKSDAGLGDAETTTVVFDDGNGHSVTATLTTRAVPPPATPTLTLTPAPTATIPAALNRPMVIVSGYDSGGNIGSGDTFTLNVNFKNNGLGQALNLVFTFSSDVFLMRDTGGVSTLSSLASGASTRIGQSMTGASTLSSQSAGTVLVKVAYNDANGEVYSESFTLTINAKAATATATTAGSGSWSTSTPTQSPRSQLVVTAYSSSVDPLQPGTSFELEMELHNTGNADARAVSMVVGGGVASTGSTSSTPEPGSASGGNSDLTNFAPLGTSNLIVLGDIPRAGAIKVKTRLIVNVNTAPGAYPLKLSFVYSDAKNNQQVDNQVITLLVYALPQVEVVFYRDPGMLVVGQPNPLPIQVTNLGRKSTILGSMKVTSDQAEVTNNVIQVGTIDAGGYFPLDAMAIPNAAGPITFNITINYNDDFNQLRTITQTLKVMAEDAPANPMSGDPAGLQPGGPGGAISLEGGIQIEESFGDRVLRFIRGFLGLDSAQIQPELKNGAPLEAVPGEIKIPAGGGGGGGGSITIGGGGKG